MTKAEFAAGHAGMHVPLTCEDHPHLRWSTKKMALTLAEDGKYRYNGTRHLFFSPWETEPECTCSTDKLYADLEEDQQEVENGR